MKLLKARGLLKLSKRAISNEEYYARNSYNKLSQRYNNINVKLTWSAPFCTRGGGGVPFDNVHIKRNTCKSSRMKMATMKTIICSLKSRRRLQLNSTTRGSGPRSPGVAHFQPDEVQGWRSAKTITQIIWKASINI